MYWIPDLKKFYIRVPKTGSSSFLHSLEERYVVSAHGYQHAIPSGPIPDSFGFVRHPYAWMLSYYRSKAWRMIDPDLQKVPMKISFDDFLDEISITPMSWLAYTTTIYRFEDIGDVFREFGIEYCHENQSQAPDLALTQAQKRRIHELMEMEFGYY